jgi:hypothetical protein
MDKEETHPMFEDIWRIFHFRCKDCDKSIKCRSKEWLKSSDIVCPYCKKNNIRYISANTSAFGTINGKVDYISAEKQSEINVRNAGKEYVSKLISDDPILKTKVNPHIPWWRDGSIEGTERRENMLSVQETKETVDKLKEIGVNFGESIS